MAWAAPDAAAFKSYFARDFAYAPTGDPDNTDFVTDADIDRAVVEAGINFNEGLYGTDTQVTAVFMYLAAHMLVVNLQNSAKGIGSRSNFPISSTSVGGVALAFSIPERYTKDPYLSQFVQDGYGMKYLALALPFLVGRVENVEGATTWWP